MQEYINKMSMISNQLKTIGATLTDEDMATQLLFSLPESYDNLVIALESRDEIPTAQQVRVRLLQEEVRCKELSENKSDDTAAALYTK